MAQDVEGALKEQQCEMAEMRSKLMRKERGQNWYSWLSCVYCYRISQFIWAMAHES